MENERRLIDALPLMKNGWHLVQTGESNRFLASMSLADVPPVDAVEVVHGRWVHDYNNLYGCSECMARETMSPKKLKNYCPNCGAKMDGERKDNE